MMERFARYARSAVFPEDRVMIAGTTVFKHHRLIKPSFVFMLIAIAFSLVLFGCGGAADGGPTTPPAGPGTTTLTWAATTSNVDGTPLLDLAGYRIYYGTEPGNYTVSIDAGNITTREVTGLPSGQTVYFSVTAYRLDGTESDHSNEVSKFVN